MDGYEKTALEQSQISARNALIDAIVKYQKVVFSGPRNMDDIILVGDAARIYKALLQLRLDANTICKYHSTEKLPE